MKRRRGRPVKQNALIGIHLRVSPAHRAELQRLADERGVQFSTLCRELLTVANDAGLRQEQPRAAG